MAAHRIVAVTSALALVLASAACSNCPAAPTLHEVQSVALFSVVSADGLPEGVPTLTLSISALDAFDKLEPSSVTGSETLVLAFDDAKTTSASCDATPIAKALANTYADVRDSANLITPKQSFSLACTGTGAWDGATFTVEAKGVTVPIRDATSFTLEVDLTATLGAATSTLIGTQAFGVVDVPGPPPKGC